MPACRISFGTYNTNSVLSKTIKSPSIALFIEGETKEDEMY